MVRGILSTVYARLRDPGLTADDCRIVIEAFYKNQPFIDILPVELIQLLNGLKILIKL